MASYVEIGNFALSKIGHDEFITSLGEDSKAARHINVNYEQVRDEVLRDHTWNFATKRVVLAPTTDVIAWGDGNYFTVPSDCVRVVGTVNPYYVYSVELIGTAKAIVYDGTVFYLKYVSRIEDSGLFDTLFVNAYSTKLAQRICIAMGRDKGLYDRLGEMYKADLAQARHVDSTESGFEEVTNDDFIAHRA